MNRVIKRLKCIFLVGGRGGGGVGGGGIKLKKKKIKKKKKKFIEVYVAPAY